MNIKRLIYIIFAVVSLLSLESCVKEKLNSIYSSQESKIDQYIEKNRYVKRTTQIVSKNHETGEIIYEADGVTPVMKDTTVTDTLNVYYKGGSTRLVTKEGVDESVNENGTVAFYYAGYVFTSGISNSGLFATNHKATAEAAGWTLRDDQDDIITVTLDNCSLVEGLRQGLVGAKASEECQIVFSGKLGFGKKAVGTVPANSAILYKVWVESVSNN